MTALFLPHSPLHLLYTLCLLPEHTGQIFLFHDFEAAPHTVEVLKARYQISLLPGLFSTWGMRAGRMAQSPSRFVRMAGKGVNHISKIQAMWAARQRMGQVERLFVFNDARPDVQGIMHSAAQQGATIIYVEDGIAPYRRNLQPSSLKQNFEFVQKLLYGGSYRATEEHGAHPLITEGYVLHPEYVNASLSTKQVKRLPPFNLDVGLILPAFSAQRFDDVERCILICLPHHDNPVFKDPTFAHTVDQVIAAHAGEMVLIKYHPREALPDFLNLEGRNGLRIIDRAIPAELLCAVLQHRLLKLYGSISSILITAKWINPAIERYLIEKNDYGLAHFLQHEGISRW